MPGFDEYEKQYGEGGEAAAEAEDGFSKLDAELDPPPDFELKRELLRRASGSNVSPGYRAPDGALRDQVSLDYEEWESDEGYRAKMEQQ